MKAMIMCAVPQWPLGNRPEFPRLGARFNYQWMRNTLFYDTVAGFGEDYRVPGLIEITKNDRRLKIKNSLSTYAYCHVLHRVQNFITFYEI